MSRTTDLLLLSVLLLAAVAVPRLRPRWRTWQRVVWRIVTFSAVTVLIGQTLGSPLQPQFDTSGSGRPFWEQLVDAGWWLLGGRVAVGFVRLLVVLENRPRETRIVSDLVAGGIYVATFLAIVSFAFSVPIRGLLATSGVIAIVLGLALQSTMSDVFSGIAVGLEKPYKPGDLLWVEGGIEGHVIQVNWRSTQIATEDNNVAVVPNSVIAKARLVNRSAPTQLRGDTIKVNLASVAVPEHCLAALTAAVRNCRILLADPEPGIACIGLHGDGTTYEISFFVASSDLLMAARTELFSQIHRHVRHDGIALAVPGSGSTPQVDVPTPAQLMAQSDWFSLVEPAHRERLASYFTPLWRQRGETLIRQGDVPEALFLIASGTVEIAISEATGNEAGGAPTTRSRVVHRMGPGETLGAIGLITGSSYAITATALTPVKVFELRKAGISAAIESEPNLAAGLEALAQRGIAVLRRGITAQDDAQLAHPEMFLARLRGFLRLLRT